MGTLLGKNQEKYTQFAIDFILVWLFCLEQDLDITPVGRRQRFDVLRNYTFTGPILREALGKNRNQARSIHSESPSTARW